MFYKACLSTIERQSLSPKERLEIESRLANYHIPIQILQIVAEECNCGEAIDGRSEARGGSKKPSLISRMNDRSLIQLKQIFLECKDSTSRFRLAVLLSSKFPPVSYKFVMAKKLLGQSNHEYILDVCVFRRDTDDLVAVGMQNNDTSKSATDAESLHKFFKIISDLVAIHSSLRSVYYSSSYGYDCNPSHLVTKKQSGMSVSNMEINFLEFRDGVYREIREE